MPSGIDPGSVKRLSCYDSLAESAGGRTARFVEGMDRGQATLLPECLEDWVDENNPVRAMDVFVEALDLRPNRPVQMTLRRS